MNGVVRRDLIAAALLSGRTGGAYASATSPLAADSPIVPQNFGAKGDGISDDTASLQSALTAATSTGRSMFIPAGHYSISRALKVPASSGWTLVGESMGSVKLIQRMPNLPILEFVGGLSHDWHISGFHFTWQQRQVFSPDSRASALLFNSDPQGSVFNFEVTSCTFSNGMRGISIDSSAESVAVWGASFERLTFLGTMSGSAFRLRGKTAIGQPNLRISKCYIDVANSTNSSHSAAANEPAIDIISPDILIIENVELNNGLYARGVPQITISSGTACSLIGVKTEAVYYSGEGALWTFPHMNVVMTACALNNVIHTGQKVAVAVSTPVRGQLVVNGLWCTGQGADLIPFSDAEAAFGITCNGNFRRSAAAINTFQPHSK